MSWLTPAQVKPKNETNQVRNDSEEMSQYKSSVCGTSTLRAKNFQGDVRNEECEGM